MNKMDMDILKRLYELDSNDFSVIFDDDVAIVRAKPKYLKRMINKRFKEIRSHEFFNARLVKHPKHKHLCNHCLKRIDLESCVSLYVVSRKKAYYFHIECFNERAKYWLREYPKTNPSNSVPDSLKRQLEYWISLTNHIMKIKKLNTLEGWIE